MAGIGQADVTRVIVTSLVERLPTSAPPLTTTFTYSSACTSHWLQLYPDNSSYSWSVYSLSAYGNLYASCQPNPKARSYSPGICLSGFTMASVTEFVETSVATDDSNRLWKAICCGRYVTRYQTITVYSRLELPKCRSFTC